MIKITQNRRFVNGFSGTRMKKGSLEHFLSESGTFPVRIRA